MTQAYVPGPAQVFVGIGSANAYQFLGYSEGGVNIRLIDVFRDIQSDFGGPDVPVDSQWMGGHAFISMTLNKYSETRLQTVVGRRLGASVTAGTIEANAIGSLMLAQSYAYPICIKNPYAGQSWQSGSAIPGYVFGAAWLTDEYSHDISVEIKRPRLVFHAVPVMNSSTLAGTLYSNVISGLTLTVD